MAKKTAKYIGLSLIAVMFLGIVAFAFPVRAVNVNVNQATFVLSNEAPGYGISALINAGYGNYNLYEVLAAIRADANPSTSGILTDSFLNALATCPASSEIFTTKLSNFSSPGTSIAISTDGTVQTVSIYGSNYESTQTNLVLNVDVSGAGNFRMVYENITQTVFNPQLGINQTIHVTSWTVNGPLAGMTTTYDVFGILYIPSGTPTPTPTISPKVTTQPTSTPSVPEFSSLTILFALIVMATLVAVVVIKKENDQTRKRALNSTSFLVTDKSAELMT
jgi:hypothetical protein